MHKINLLLLTIALFITFSASAQKPSTTQNRRTYLHILDDAHFDIGVNMTAVFALDDRAPLSSNPHFEAMWNLIRLGAKLESLLQGTSEPLNNIDLAHKFGQNGYNKTVFTLFCRYGFGESSDLAIQRHFLELAVSPGYFKEGNGGMNIHLDYQLNIAKTGYGAGAQSIERAFDYEIFAGARVGFDWSSGRSEGEAGFFAHLNNELKRIADENEFTASQLIMLQDLAENSKILLPKDVGGRALHAGPILGARISKHLFRNGQIFASGMGFYDMLDLVNGNGQKENRRSQHHVALSLGFNLTIGAQGEMLDFF